MENNVEFDPNDWQGHSEGSITGSYKIIFWCTIGLAAVIILAFVI